MQFLIIATAYVSIYTLVFMSLDRFLAVVFPIESMTVRNDSNNCRAVIAATWVVAIIVCSPVFLANGEIRSGQHKYCTFKDNHTIEFLPESWGARWSGFSFQVIAFVRFFALLSPFCALS